MEQNPEWTFLKVHITLNKKIGLEKPVKVKKVDMHIFYNAHISFSRTWKVQYENSYRPSAIDSDYTAPLCITLRIKTWVVACFYPKKH